MITTPSQQTRIQTMIPLLAICLGYFIMILDVTIVNVALVDIKEHLSANVTGQVGGVVILGTLVGEHQTFLSGMHTALMVCAGVLILGLLSAWGFVSEQRHPKVAIAPKPSRTARRAEIALEGREKPE